MSTPTIIVPVLPQARAATAPRPRAPRPVVRPITLTPVRKLTRAHLGLLEQPHLTTDGLAARDAVAAHLSTQLGVKVAITSRLADATLQPLSHLAERGCFAVLELGGDALAVLELEPVCVSALLAHAAGSPPDGGGTGHLTRIEEAALGWLLLSTLAALRGLPCVEERFSPRLVSLHHARADLLAHVDGRRRHLAVSLSVTVGDRRGAARLVLPATWLETVLAALPLPGPSPIDEVVGRACLEATVMLGLLQVEPDEARAFRPGDVVVFPGVRSAASLTGPARLVTRGFALHGAFGAEGFTFTHALPHPLEPTMTHIEADPLLPVDVEIELTRLRLPLHRLGGLKPGAVLALHVTAAQTVVVKVGDRAVARAELVEVEGEIGARILSMIEGPR
jgi:type III secretion protein Q